MTKSVNVNLNPSFSKVELNKDNVQQTIVKSSQAVSDSFESNSAVKTISSSADDGGFAQAAPLVPLLYVADKFIDTKMGGDVQTNILGKAAKLGDKISDKLGLEKFISEEKISAIKSKIDTNRFTKYFTNSYKANPICSMAKPTSFATTMASKLDEQAQKLVSVFTDIKYSKEAMEKLKEAGTVSAETLKLIEETGPLTKRLTPDFLTSASSVIDEFSGILTENDANLANNLKGKIKLILTISPDDVPQQELSEQLAAFFKKFTGGKYNGKTVNTSKLANEVLSSVSDKTFSTDQILNAVDDLVANGVNLDTKNLSITRNKAAAATSKLGESTLGKIFSKGIVKTKDVATYGGGLISLFFMASSIHNAVKATKEAPKGEKKATFMHVLSEQYLGMILFQPSINLVYKAAGNKYRGMSVEGRKALADLISKTNADETLTKEALKVAKMQKKLLLKGVDENKVADLAGKGLKEAKEAAKSLKGQGAKLKFWEKPLKAAGNLLGMGLDKMKTPKFLNIAGKKIKIPQPTLKGFVGGLGRFALIMFVVQPLIQKPITKLCHKIFGEPKSYLEKQKANEKAKETPSEKQNNAQTVAFDPNISSDTNLVKKYMQKGVTQIPSAATQISSDDSQPIKPTQSQDEIPALNIFNKNKQERYIPQIVPYVETDNSKEVEARVNQILKQTDKVVDKTQKYL